VYFTQRRFPPTPPPREMHDRFVLEDGAWKFI